MNILQGVTPPRGYVQRNGLHSAQGLSTQAEKGGVRSLGRISRPNLTASPAHSYNREVNTGVCKGGQDWFLFVIVPGAGARERGPTVKGDHFVKCEESRGRARGVGVGEQSCFTTH